MIELFDWRAAFCVSLVLTAHLFAFEPAYKKAQGTPPGGPQNPAYKREIAALKLDERHPVKSIHLWDDQIVAEMVSRKKRTRFYSLSAHRLRPVELIVPGLDELISIGTASKVAFALGKTKGRVILVRKDGGRWVELPEVSRLQRARSARIIPSKEGLAILSRDFLFQFRNGKWEAVVPIPNVPDFHAGFKPEKWGVRQVLYGSQLFVGWQCFEGGGMLASLDISGSKRKWTDVSRGAIANDLGHRGITGMTIDESGQLWISHGSDVLGLVTGGLFRYDGVKWTTITSVFSDIFTPTG
jgi:hypothetical protein